MRVVDLGNKLELTNRTRTDIVVLGYDGEPYLRVGPRGVYENLRSPATYLNRTRVGHDAGARDRDAEPARRPRRVGIACRERTPRSGTTTASTGWARRRHPTVQRDPGAFHTVDPQWTVVFRYDGADRRGARLGSTGFPGPSGWPWAPFVVALFAIGFFVARRRGRAA